MTAPEVGLWHNPVSLAFYNVKGGVAKTHACIDTAILFAREFGPLLLIDSDHQGNATTNVGCNPLLPGLREVLDGTSTLEACLQQCPDEPGLFVLGPGTRLQEISNPDELPGGRKTVARGYAQHILNEIQAANEARALPFQAVFYDMNPNMALLTDAILMIVPKLIVPVTPTDECYTAVGLLLTQLEKAREDNPAISILGVLITKYVKCKDHDAMIEAYLATFPKDIGFFNTFIPLSRAAESASTFKQPIVIYVKNNPASKHYRWYFKELAPRLKEAFGYGA